MLQIGIIVFVSIIVLLFHFYNANDGILAPESAYALAFIPTSICLCMYIEKWDIDFHYKTVWVIILGLIVFSMTTYMVKRARIRKIFFIKLKLSKGYSTAVNNQKSEAKIAIWKYIFFICFQLITLLLLYRYITSIVGSGSFGIVMNAIRQASVAEYINLDTWINIMRSICLASGHIWVYLLIYNIQYKSGNKLTNILLVINIMLSSVISILLGGRGNLIATIVTAWILYYALGGVKKGSKKQKKTRKKSYMYAGIISILGILLFQAFGRAMGRSLEFSELDYFAIYFVAPTKNLDTFIRESENVVSLFKGISSGISTNQTLYTALNYVSISLGIPSWYHTRSFIDMTWPNRHVNGYYLGNCYTVYAPYLYDGGYFAVIIYTIIHAFLCQIVYEMAMRNMPNGKNERVKISIIIYCEIWYYTFFSFFTDMFYYHAITIGFFRSIIYLLLIKWFLYDVNIGKRQKL